MKATITVDRPSQGTVIHEYAKLPWFCWITPSNSPGVLLFLRFPDQPGKLVKLTGSGGFWDAEPCFEDSKPWTLLTPTQLTVIGDNRPIVDNTKPD